MNLLVWIFLIPTSGNCCKKCNDKLNKKDYTEEFVSFLRDEKYRGGSMRISRIHHFYKKHNFYIGYFHGSRLVPRRITETVICLYIHENHFCVKWKLQNVSFNKTIDEKKSNFRVVDSILCNRHVKCFNKFEYKPKKVHSQLTNAVVYDIKSFITIKCVPYAICIYKSSGISSSYYRDAK